MNTKSFVNGLDPDNTVKGYYDENDQLVLVEPEGSGGDSDFTTATLTVEESTGEGNGISIVNITEEGITTKLLPIPGSYEIVLYKGSQMVVIPRTYTVSGSATFDPEVVAYNVTGDFSIKFNGGDA